MCGMKANLRIGCMHAYLLVQGMQGLTFGQPSALFSPLQCGRHALGPQGVVLAVAQAAMPAQNYHTVD